MIEQLLHDLDDPGPEVRLHAARQLAEQKSPHAFFPMTDLLKNDPDPEVRTTAAWALGELGNPEAASSLRMAFLDPDSRVVTAAKEAVEKLPELLTASMELPGKPIGLDPIRFRPEWEEPQNLHQKIDRSPEFDFDLAEKSIPDESEETPVRSPYTPEIESVNETIGRMVAVFKFIGFLVLLVVFYLGALSLFDIERAWWHYLIAIPIAIWAALGIFSTGR